jgi:hypothetical protein
MVVSIAQNTVTLAWSAGSGNATSYVVEAGSSPGLTNLANSDLGSAAPALTATNVAAGTYYVRVRAKNACGVSAPSNEVVLTVQSGATQTITGVISGGDTLCVYGIPPFTFTGDPCRVFEFTSIASGRIDATLTWNGDDALLALELYNPITGRVVSFGDLTFDPYPSRLEHSTLSAIIPAGRYQFFVSDISPRKIASFTLVTTHN